MSGVPLIEKACRAVPDRDCCDMLRGVRTVRTLSWKDAVVYLRPTWQLSWTVAAVLLVAALVLSRMRRAEAARSFAREFAVIAGLFGLWQIVGRLARTRSAGAMERAVQIDDLQRWLHLPDQLALQHAALPHPWLIESMNLYYLSAHLNGTGLFLLWVWWRRRESFRTVRNTLVATTFTCLAIQLIPVAPPRLLPGSGYSDTALLYGQSVYGTYNDGLAAQLTAMPSVHVAWACIVAWYVARLGRGPLRWLGAVHLFLTVMVVVVTANHWWLDGVVAGIIVAAVIGAQFLITRRFNAPAPEVHARVTPVTSGS